MQAAACGERVGPDELLPPIAPALVPLVEFTARPASVEVCGLPSSLRHIWGHLNSLLVYFLKSLRVAGWFATQNLKPITALMTCKGQVKVFPRFLCLYRLQPRPSAHSPTLSPRTWCFAFRAPAVPTSPQPFRPTRAQTALSIRASPTSVPGRNSHLSRLPPSP